MADEFFPNRSTEVFWIAALLAKQFNLLAAEEMYVRALAGYRKVLGRGHPRAVATIRELSHCYHQQGKIEAAEQLSTRVDNEY